MLKRAKDKITDSATGLLFHPTYAPLTGLIVIVATLYLNYKSMIDDKTQVVISRWGTLTFSGVLFAIGILFIISPFLKVYIESKRKK